MQLRDKFIHKRKPGDAALLNKNVKAKPTEGSLFDTHVRPRRKVCISIDFQKNKLSGPQPLTEYDYQRLAKTTKGWTAAKFSYHGMRWPPQKGWRKKLLREYKEKNCGLSACLPPTDIAYVSPADMERLSMKKLYQQKSGDYSY